jgi:hypothetical protein
MNLRRDRRHQCGNSNQDYKALTLSELGRPTTMSHLDYLSLPKMKTLNDLMAKRERQSKTTVNPVESTTGFYKELNRVKKTHPD